MKKSDLIRHFRTQSKAAAALGVTKSAVSQWADIVPEGIAYKAQIITGGALRADPALYDHKRRRAEKAA